MCSCVSGCTPLCTWYLDVHLYIWMYSSVYLCIWMYTSVYLCMYTSVLPMYLDIHRCVLVYLDVHQCVPVYLDVHQCVPVYPDVHQCVPVYPDVHQCIPVYLDVHQCVPVYHIARNIHAFLRSKYTVSGLTSLSYIPAFYSHYNWNLYLSPDRYWPHSNCISLLFLIHTLVPIHYK